MVLVLGIVKASLEILGIGIGVKKVVLLISVMYCYDSTVHALGIFFKSVNGKPSRSP